VTRWGRGKEEKEWKRGGMEVEERRRKGGGGRREGEGRRKRTQ
jgi:hypothetical protein